MPRFLICLSLLLLWSCSAQRPVDTSFSIVSMGSHANLLASDVPGGLVLMGRSADKNFSAGLAPSQVASFGLELPVGQWEFFAIAWMGPNVMGGPSKCAYASVNLQGGSATIDMTLATATCQQPNFASNSAIDPNVQQFKSLLLNSCLNPIGKDPSSICDGSDLANLSNIPGESFSARVSIRGESNFGQSLPSLTTQSCFNLQGLSAKSRYPQQWAHGH
jgi:hypothetical protein